ncbi:cytochrome c biogenesis protein ResA [Gordonia hirsuta DSM 44140 = NBRC 16056]|uniref:Cytochrome c biogenesis protein ResA n=1 Tax=Gordonia hirsuta DSM 44140 = NBRC 16056 TaxID=1121927 RepID=L7L9W9_9ACTN|nr:cytochrome c biogenesis protein ResA [Gordonia hirsuta DSM 44140 = NBRC 16056]
MRSRFPRPAALTGALALIGVLLLTGCATGDDAVVRGQGNVIVAPGGQTVIHYPVDERKPIGPVSGERLDGDGTVDLNSYKGQVVVVNVWASWCPPCRKEATELEAVYQQTKDRGVAFVGINFRDNRSAASDFATDRGLTYPSIYDYGGRNLKALGVPVGAVPTTVILDRQLRPAVVYLKAIGEKELREQVLQVVAEGDSPQ